MGDLDIFYLSESSNKENILVDCFNVQCDFTLKNVFFRNINGEGGISGRGKFIVKLSGSGYISNFDKSKEVVFFSSKIFMKDLGSRSAMGSFNEGDDVLECFYSAYNNYISNSSTVMNSSLKFPVLYMLVVEFVQNQSKWMIKLEEK